MVQDSEPSNHGPEQNLLSQTLGIQLGYIQPEHHHNSFLTTHVFDDIFHGQNQLLKTLSKMQSAFDSFAWELSQVILVKDNDCHSVEEMLAKKGKTWEKWCVQILMHCIDMFNGFVSLPTSLFLSYKLLYPVGRMSSAPLT
jgi:hypothetical protein